MLDNLYRRCPYHYSGEFGIVYKAQLKARFNERFTETVAVKTLKGFLQKELVTDLLKECAKMKELDHPNILPLRGVCLDGGPAPYIIMPFMVNGSLLGHLKENRESLVIDSSSTDLDKVVSKYLQTVYYIHTCFSMLPDNMEPMVPLSLSVLSKVVFFMPP